MLVLDYSWARPSPAAIKGAGYSGVIRYLSFEPSKNLSRAERDALWAEGLSIGLVWEATPQAPLQGYARGVSDAREANRQADAFGWPPGVVIIYAIDFDVTASQMPAIRAYFKGAKSVGLRPAGVYGPDHVLDDLAGNEPVACSWQCAAWSGTGQGTGGSIYVPAYGRNVQLSRTACLFQFWGSVRLGETDHNESTGHAGHQLADLMYHPSGHAPPPPSMEDLIMKAVYLPDEPEGQPKFWQPIDGLRRVLLENPPGDDPATDLAELAMLLAIDAVGQAVTLTGHHADLFKARYHPTDAHTVHWGDVLLMVEGVKRVSAELAKVQVTVDAGAIAAAVAEHLKGAGSISAQLTDADVVRIAVAVADEGHRRSAQ